MYKSFREKVQIEIVSFQAQDQNREPACVAGHARFICSVSVCWAYDRFAVARRAAGRRMFSRAVRVVPECGVDRHGWARR